MKGTPIAALLGLIGLGFLLWWFSQNQSAAAAAVSGSDDLKTPDTWPGGDRIWDVCRAIAHAEGYDVVGSAPYKLNNPGDLSPGDEHGFSTAGAAEFHGGSYVIHFATPADGWNALYAKFANILDGSSKVYQADWSWQQIGAKYAADPNWSANVAATLDVDPVTTLRDYVENA
jgi:hypothetical protein